MAFWIKYGELAPLKRGWQVSKFAEDDLGWLKFQPLAGQLSWCETDAA
jgi:hypothetical protein